MPPAVIYAFQFEISLFIHRYLGPAPRAPCRRQLARPDRRRAHAETLSLPHLQAGNWLSSHFITVWRLCTLVWGRGDPSFEGRRRARARGRRRRRSGQVPAWPQWPAETKLQADSARGREAPAGPARPERVSAGGARARRRGDAEGTRAPVTRDLTDDSSASRRQTRRDLGAAARGVAGKRVQDGDAGRKGPLRPPRGRRNPGGGGGERRLADLGGGAGAAEAGDPDVRGALGSTLAEARASWGPVVCTRRPLGRASAPARRDPGRLLRSPALDLASGVFMGGRGATSMCACATLLRARCFPRPPTPRGRRTSLCLKGNAKAF